MDDLKKIIGERLKEARLRAGFKQNRVAKSIGIDNTTLSKYESGEREADNETLLKLTGIYDVTIQWVMTGKENSEATIAEEKELHGIDKEIRDELISMEPEDKEYILERIKKIKKSY